jgi:ABC-type Mn2+/Zn2+ transport system permease subunit
MTLPVLITACAMAIACATLSVFVVARRWAFIGEGISHSGLGGAGTAWLLALVFPALDPQQRWMPYVGVIVFCILTAVGIAYVTRERRVAIDTAIGIFMVASLAWGFVARDVFVRARHVNPAGWESFVFGNPHGLSLPFAVASVAVCAGVVAVVALMSKEIVFYCFDPAMAEASGVRAGFVHYLLILLVTFTIIIGARVVGTVLVTAMLVLPGATALAVSSRLRHAVGGAVAVGLGGTLAGLWASRRWDFLAAGPAIVLAMFLVFVVAFGWRRTQRG